MANHPIRWTLGVLAGLGAGAVAWGNWQVARGETLDPEEAAPDGAFVTVDGLRLHYVERGTGKRGAPPVLLLHGFASSLWTWRHTLPALAAAGHHVLALDLRGFGYSARDPSRDYTLRRGAALVAAFLTALDIPRAIVVGHSAGGGIALQLAVAHPQRVARLVLVDALAGGNESRRPPAALAAILFAGPLGRAFIHYTFGNPRFARRAIAAAYAVPARLSDVAMAGYTAPLAVRGTAAALVAMTTSPRDDDLPAAIPQIRVPTLILWGAEDRLVPPAVGERLLGLIPDSRLELLPDTGHLPQEEDPAAFNAALGAFLAVDGPALVPLHETA